MNYGFSDLEVQKRPFPVSDCVTNCELQSAAYGTHGDYEFIDFIYTQKNEEGIATLKDRMFAINFKNITPSPLIAGDTKEAAEKREFNKFATRLKHVATKFGISEDDLKAIPSGSFAQLAKTYCLMVSSKCKGVMLYCKTIRDKSGYAKMARYPSFLQRMDTGNCELKYSSSEMSQITSNTATNGAAVKETKATETWV